MVIFRQMQLRYFRLVGPVFHPFGVPRGVNGTNFHLKQFNFGFDSPTKPMLADLGRILGLALQCQAQYALKITSRKIVVVKFRSYIVMLIGPMHFKRLSILAPF